MNSFPTEIQKPYDYKREKTCLKTYSMVFNRQNEKEKKSNVAKILQLNDEHLYPSKSTEFL